MKKLIAFAVALLFLSVSGIAAATDVQISGDYYVRGSYQKNAEGDNAMTAGIKGGTVEESGTMYYDHELNMEMNLKIDDNTIIFTQFEMRDETWGSNNPKEDSLSDPKELYTDSDDDGFVDADTDKNGDISAAEFKKVANKSELDDNIAVEKVYVWHKFANGHETKLGLMSGGEWGTSFHDAADDVYRVRYDIPTDAVRIVGILEKAAESSSTSNGQGETGDVDKYILGLLTKLGPINFKPLFVYVNKGNTSDVLVSYIAFDGEFGNLGFEAEFGVSDTNYEASATTDARTYGAYANLWYASGPVQAGILGAFGSYDDDANAAHGFGGDFDAGGAMIIGVDGGFGFNKSTGVVADTLAGGRLAALYADYDVSDKLSVGGYAGFAKCGIDDNGKWDGAKAWEVSADAAYKITDNIVYDLGAGVAQLKYGGSTADPDKAFRLFHRLTVNF